jgi:hypothetical protein
MAYHNLIKEICKSLSIVADPRHIEGFMRLQYGTMNHLSREDFVRECKLFNKVKEIGDWEANAKTYGI